MQGKSGMDMYKEFEIDRDQGNFDKLPELHAVLSGMKAGPFTASRSYLYACVPCCRSHWRDPFLSRVLSRHAAVVGSGSIKSPMTALGRSECR